MNAPKAFLLLLAVSCCWAEKIVIGSSNPKKTRMFSIFHIINFPNSQCTTFSTANTNLVMFGTCVSADTCLASAGIADGNCASGFGVCCMHSVSACGSTITQNLTYIQNPGFPGSFGTNGMCQYNFQASKEICQIRLDYNVLQVANPDARGNCLLATSDNVVVTSPTGANPPVICGLNSGQHIYFETSRQQNAGNIQFQLQSTNPGQTRTWKIKTTFLDCNSLWRAPADCLQYLTGTTGSFKSFNYQTTAPQMLQSENYNVCIRQNEGYCSNDYTVDSTAANVVNPFKLLANSLAKRGGCLSITNTNSYITIPTIASMMNVNLGTMNFLSNSEYFCGAYLNSVSGTGANGVVTSQVPPFLVGVFSPNNQNLDTGIIGFALKYDQVAC